MSEYIELSWEDEPFFEAVTGHVSEQEFRRIVNEQRPDIEIPEGWQFRQCYGRWIPDSSKRFDVRLIFENTSKRGNWPVTIAEFKEI